MYSKRRRGGVSIKHLNFIVDDDFFKRVKVDAALKGVTLKDYLKTAVELYLKQFESTKQEG